MQCKGNCKELQVDQVVEDGDSDYKDGHMSYCMSVCQCLGFKGERIKHMITHHYVSK